MPCRAVYPLIRLESHRMSTVSQDERRKPWEEHNVFASLVLAVLIPGLGHLYQGRTIKGLIYLFGILGLFLWGVVLGEGIVVYNLPERGATRQITLHYAAQLGAGAVSYPALWQTRRMAKDNHAVRQLERPLSAKFSGHLINMTSEKVEGHLIGTVKLEPTKGEYGAETAGVFTGTLEGKPIELPLEGSFYLDPPIAAGFRRTLKCNVAAATEDGSSPGTMITGFIPRSLVNSYGVPPDPDQLQEVTGRLGKQHELALVFTWIAGLLNILAIWDCVQGPAYGFGDETWTKNEPEKDPTSAPAPVPATNPTPTA